MNINAKPEQFLDWDRPLNQQSQHVQGPLRGVVKNPNMDWSQTGEKFIKSLGHDPQNSAILNQRGIPGIRYLDQGSRMPSYTGNPAEMLIQEFGSLDNALKTVRSKVDGALSSDVKSYWSKRLGELEKYPKPTSNYVLFNDQIIDILKKWGLAGGMAGAGAAGASDQSQAQPFGSLSP